MFPYALSHPDFRTSFRPCSTKQIFQSYATEDLICAQGEAISPIPLTPTLQKFVITLQEKEMWNQVLRKLTKWKERQWSRWWKMDTEKLVWANSKWKKEETKQEKKRRMTNKQEWTPYQHGENEKWQHEGKWKSSADTHTRDNIQLSKMLLNK